MSERVTLVAPDGREFVTSSRREIVDLKSRGYTVKPEKARPAARKVEDKPAAKPEANAEVKPAEKLQNAL